MALPTLLQNSTYLWHTFSQKLDTLASFNQKLTVTLENLEGQVSQAEVNLGATSSFRSMMNYFVSSLGFLGYPINVDFHVNRIYVSTLA